MKVSELAKLVQKTTYFNVLQTEKWLDGEYPTDFFDCELEIKEITVGNCQTLIVEVHHE
ncbi:TPA: hypothetical protein ACGOY9_001002 [Streptococcus suis]